jgi:hypothetical protein
LKISQTHCRNRFPKANELSTSKFNYDEQKEDSVIFEASEDDFGACQQDV